MFVSALAFILTAGLGVVFLASAIPKLRRPKSFVLVVIEYQVVPECLATAVAWILPPTELGVAWLLLIGVLPEIASLGAAVLLMGFIVGIGINLARGRRIACGCFGHQRTIGWPLLFQDVGLLGASVLATVLSRHEGIVASWSVIRVFDAPSWLPVLSSVACAIALGIVAIRTFAQRPPSIRPISQRTRRSS